MKSMISSNNSHLTKIKELGDLAEVLETVRSDGKSVVQCHGVFDLLHIGHIRHFEHAKEMGDILVVTITADIYVNKGPSRPAFGETLRAEAIAALGCVDYVAINNHPDAVVALRTLQPSVYVKGSDYKDAESDRTGKISAEEEAVESGGGRLAFTEDITYSSSNLINHHIASAPKEVSEYVTAFSSRYGTSDVLKYLDNSKGLKVLVIGETIIDEYSYCDVLGKSGKEPILAAKHVGTERFAGGIVAIANHVSAFVDQVTMLTFLGRNDSQEEFIRERLDPKVSPVFLHLDGDAPTITKRRFVEADRFLKLFEMYVMGDGENKTSESTVLCENLALLLPEHDLIIVADYGHGMLGPEAVDLICAKSRFLAVNSQINAGNHGFNVITKYPRADYICISEGELRLDARSRVKDLKEIVTDLSSKISCESIVVTRGERGSLCYSQAQGFFEIPAFTSHVIDRIGAGDAVLSISALCMGQGAPVEVAGFVGNVSGASAVATVGNRNAVEAVSLIRHVETLLK